MSTTYDGFIAVTIGPIGVTTVNGLLFVITLCEIVDIVDIGDNGMLTDKGDNGDTGLIVYGVNGDNTVVLTLEYGELNIVVIGV